MDKISFDVANKKGLEKERIGKGPSSPVFLILKTLTGGAASSKPKHVDLLPFVFCSEVPYALSKAGSSGCRNPQLRYRRRTQRKRSRSGCSGSSRKQFRQGQRQNTRQYLPRDPLLTGGAPTEDDLGSPSSTEAIQFIKISFPKSPLSAYSPKAMTVKMPKKFSG